MAKAKSKAAFMISAVAEQYGIHPQTLRLYEREGLLKPSRSEGNTRLYTSGDVERLEVILHLTRDLGVNLAGVEIILNMREKMGDMQAQIQEFIATLNRELAARTSLAVEPEDHYWLVPEVKAGPPRPPQELIAVLSWRLALPVPSGNSPHACIRRALRSLRRHHGGGEDSSAAGGLALPHPLLHGAGGAALAFPPLPVVPERK